MTDEPIAKTREAEGRITAAAISARKHAPDDTRVGLLRCVRASVPALVIAAAVLALFIDKAFTIDDGTFLTMADHMLVDPLHPAAVQMVHSGQPAEHLSTGVWSGPAMPTLLVPAVAAGGAEWLAHLVMLVVFAMGIVATAGLALRLGLSEAGARWATLLVTTSAAVLAMATTSMPDVPAMAFSVVAAERVLACKQTGASWRGVMASLAFAAAVLSRQHVVLVAPCLMLLVHDNLRRSLAVIGGGLALVALTYAIMHDGGAVDGLTTRPIDVCELRWLELNLANIPAQWALCFPLALCVCWLDGRSMLRSYGSWLGGAVGVVLAVGTQQMYRHSSWLVWQAPITAVGCAVLFHVVADAARRRDTVDLGLAAWLFIAVPVAAYLHLPAKYLVPSAPAMAILIVRLAERGVGGRSYVLPVSIGLGLVLGLMIIRADAQLADVGRTGGDVAGAYVARGERVWSDGSWGFQWYSTRAGAQPLTSADRPAPGDIVVVGLNGWLARGIRDKILVERIDFDDSGGRVAAGVAGFYSNNGWGPLPWAWSRHPLARIEVWRIAASDRSSSSDRR